ncbi:MAG: hypothetical protein IT276_02700 [Ignavibacteriaceae bacterium]|nr:hypothetical protein [Ignavibacterium sp.]MCC6253799.1 hypothetical protein [Ignavibacteriaceae bacterium]HRN25156.1 hypothetical protein [Ignavibacteriaceae bacterium]HRP92306.1 hypothetical protein [Ignavibacteriaceae bacterium]HRQ53364.1 hypothetical protein [Ignavibacteriaceae bacterium]
MKYKKLKYFILIIISIIIIVRCVEDNTNGENKMESTTIASSLKKVDVNDYKKLDSLSEEIILRSRKDGRELVNILHSSDAIERKKAANLILALGDLAVIPMLDSLDTENPENYAWEMDAIVTSYLEDRNKIVNKINSMLSDKRLMKTPELMGVSEEQPIPRRVCDEAYLLLRKILAFKDDEEELMTNERLFLGMSDGEKDEEISRLKSSKEWISLSEKMMNEGNF